MDANLGMQGFIPLSTIPLSTIDLVFNQLPAPTAVAAASPSIPISIVGEEPRAPMESSTVVEEPRTPMESSTVGEEPQQHSASTINLEDIDTFLGNTRNKVLSEQNDKLQKDVEHYKIMCENLRKEMSKVFGELNSAKSRLALFNKQDDEKKSLEARKFKSEIACLETEYQRKLNDAMISLRKEKRIADEANAALRKEKRIADEANAALMKEKRIADEALMKEKRLADEALRKEQRLADEARNALMKEKRSADEAKAHLKEEKQDVEKLKQKVNKLEEMLLSEHDRNKEYKIELEKLREGIPKRMFPHHSMQSQIMKQPKYRVLPLARESYESYCSRASAMPAYEGYESAMPAYEGYASAMPAYEGYASEMPAYEDHYPPMMQKYDHHYASVEHPSKRRAGEPDLRGVLHSKPFIPHCKRLCYESNMCLAHKHKRCAFAHSVEELIVCPYGKTCKIKIRCGYMLHSEDERDILTESVKSGKKEAILCKEYDLSKTCKTGDNCRKIHHS
jgi:hypothetical protein